MKWDQIGQVPEMPTYGFLQNHNDFKADFRIMVLDVKIPAKNNCDTIPHIIKGVSPTATLITSSLVVK